MYAYIYTYIYIYTPVRNVDGGLVRRHSGRVDVTRGDFLSRSRPPATLYMSIYVYLHVYRHWNWFCRKAMHPFGYMFLNESQPPKIRNPKPETRISKPETRNPKLETRNSKPEKRNPKLGTRNPKLETRNSEPKTRNPKPQAGANVHKPHARSLLHGAHLQNPTPEPQNPKFEMQQSRPLKCAFFGRDWLLSGTHRMRSVVPHGWSTTLSLKANLPHANDLRGLCGANLVT